MSTEAGNSLAELCHRKLRDLWSQRLMGPQVGKSWRSKHQ